MAKTNFQTRAVLIVRFLLGDIEDREEGIMGKAILVNGEMKRNNRGKTRLVITYKNEEERVKALKEHFDIILTEEEINGIKGRNVELLEDN
jgi:hypothetical protein